MWRSCCRAVVAVVNRGRWNCGFARLPVSKRAEVAGPGVQATEQFAAKWGDGLGAARFSTLGSFLDQRTSRWSVPSNGESSSMGGQLRWSSGSGGGEDPGGVESSSLLPEKEFHSIANTTLDELQEKIEAYGEDLDVDGFDLDYSDGVMTVRLGNLGTYVLNKQTPNRQLWLSSPVSGPARFDWVGSKNAWVYNRSKAELISLLEKELSELLESPVILKN